MIDLSICINLTRLLFIPQHNNAEILIVTFYTIILIRTRSHEYRHYIHHLKCTMHQSATFLHSFKNLENQECITLEPNCTLYNFETELHIYKTCLQTPISDPYSNKCNSASIILDISQHFLFKPLTLHGNKNVYCRISLMTALTPSPIPIF